ncbi:MAG: hypothetical protein K2O40_05180, partial [Lachnospiraceae bacterium]|nr:hypothetical protein [Lachnospiraceae bacterium]
IEDVDMGRVGQAVGNAVIKLVDFIGQALSQTNWYMLGQKVVDFIAGIDWMGLFTSLVEALAGILGNVIGGAFALVAALSEGIANLIINAVDAAKEYFQGKIEECGGNIVLGILKGIIDGIAGIGNWIYEHILEPFITGFKNAFGIHSPSTVMMEMGTYIIQGLLDGITSLVDKVTETWESMKEKALETWENVKTGLSEKWENTKEKASEIWGNVKDNFAETWNLIEESASEKWSDIKENLSGKWEDMKTNASTIFTDLKTSLSGIWNEISTTVSDKWNEIKTTISGVVDDVKGKIDGFISNIKDAIQSVKDFFSSGIDKIGSAISGAFSGGGGSVAAFSGVSTYSAMPQIAALSKMEFPGYATGQVIPTSMKKHLAWLGDNNRETEVVSPLSTMKQANKEAILEVLSELGITGGNGRSTGGETYVFQVDGKTFFEVTRNEAQKYFSRTGRSPYPT